MTNIFAHRGASSQFPENTMIAFKQALKDGADGIELDVQLTRDYVPVIIHDETVNRTTNGHGLVKDHTLRQLKLLNASKQQFIINEHGPIQIPTLEEFLKWIEPTHLLLNIELKNNLIDYPNIEQMVIGLVHKYSMTNRTIYSSFNHNSLLRMKAIDRYSNTSILYKGRLMDAARYAKAHQANGVHPNYHVVSKQYIEYMHQNKLSVRAYTVNHPKAINHLLAWNIDGIFTDHPKLAVDIKKHLSKNYNI